MVSPPWPAASHLQALAAEAGLMAAEASTEGGRGGGRVPHRGRGGRRTKTKNMLLEGRGRIKKGIEIEYYVYFEMNFMWMTKQNLV